MILATKQTLHILRETGLNTHGRVNTEINQFTKVVHQHLGTQLFPLSHSTLQVNIGRRCNQLCKHCHLNASPDHTDAMTHKTMRQVLEFAQHLQPDRLDITGGAPELHPHLCSFIESARDIINHIQLRTNLTVLKQPRMSSTLRYFCDNQVKLIASLPCYEPDEVDSQRGSGVFHTSIRVLQHLNHIGYGLNPELQLDLVYNPEGAFLPPPQSRLETTYRKILSEEHNIVFNRLLTITNMPIGRFNDFLKQSHQHDHYFELLRSSFNPLTLERLMCRHQIHVGPSGQVYDCDFNFALGLPSSILVDNLSEVSSQILLSREIVIGDHCYGCTAGSGSSCEGALDG